MSPKGHSPEMHEEQGALFETHVVPSGVTDPALVGKSTETYEPVPGGVYPEAEPEAEPAPEDTVAVSALREAVKKDNRHKGQLGKHSPLQRDGAYADLENNTSFVKAGDVLPRFGIVTYSNIAAAEQHARMLEQERRDRRR
jgi:hypothetical protein